MKTSIIILSYNNRKYLQALIRSLEITIPKDCEIVIVDNGSNKHTCDYLKKYQRKRKEHKVIFLKKNKGYSAGNNIGAEVAMGEYLIFLNNDMVACHGWIQPLLKELKKRTTGVVGAKLLFPDKTIQHAGLDVFCNMYPFSRNYRLPNRKDKETGPVKVMAVTGACLGVRKDLFTEVGGFDEKYKLVFQDLDLCYKVLKKKKNVVYRPDAKLYHYESLSLNRGSKQKTIDEDFKYLKRKWQSQFNAIIDLNMKHIKKELKDAKLIVYGTGLMARMISKSLKKYGIKVFGYMDIDKKVKPKAISLPKAKILIASVFQYEIKNKLKKAGITIPVIDAVTHVKDVYRVFQREIISHPPSPRLRRGRQINTDEGMREKKRY